MHRLANIRSLLEPESGMKIKPMADAASNLLAIDFRLDVRIACNDLQQKFKQTEYFTCNPLITRPISS